MTSRQLAPKRGHVLLREWVAGEGRSAAGLARASKISPPTISRILNPKRNQLPKLATAQAIASATGDAVPLESWLEGPQELRTALADVLRVGMEEVGRIVHHEPSFTAEPCE